MCKKCTPFHIKSFIKGHSCIDLYAFSQNYFFRPVTIELFVRTYLLTALSLLGMIKNSPSDVMSTYCGNEKKMSFFVKLLDVADVSSLNKTKNLQGRAEETFKSAIAFLLSSVMLNQVKCISGLSNLHLSKVFSVRYLFCGFSFLCLCFYVNDLYSNFTDPLQKQISIKQDTF